MVNLQDLKKEVQKILKEGKIKYFIGYEKIKDEPFAKPAFIKKPEDVKKLTWDPTCVHNLARFLVFEKKRRASEKEPDERPVGIMVKGCDSRAINVLLQEKFINREDVYIIGVSCENSGVIDEEKLSKKLKNKQAQKIDFGEKDNFVVTTNDGKMKVPSKEILADNCLECKASYPVVYDVFLGEKIERKPEDPFESIKKIESLSPKEKYKFWKEQLDKCIRCYACRSVCPMCYCDECVVDSIELSVTAETTADEKAKKIIWTEKSPVLSENFTYHLVRALHMAGRCVDCGECERVCPVDIPIRLLNKKLEKEAADLFDYEAGFDSDRPPLLSSFKEEDPQDFIR